MLSFWILTSVLMVSARRIVYYGNEFYDGCFCKTCPSNSTVGVVRNGICYYITDEYTQLERHSFYNFPVSVSSKEFLDVFHIVTMLYYLKFQTNLIISPFRTELKYRSLIRLPSTLALAACPVYDIRRNLVYDEYNDCNNRPYFSNTKIYNLTMNSHVNRFKEIKRVSPSCFRVKYAPCEMFVIDTMGKYEQYMSNSLKKYHELKYNSKDQYLYKIWSAQIVYYDPTTVVLSPDDYMMHVATYTNYSSPAGCHIFDFARRKIFQQSSCSEAFSNLESDYHEFRLRKVPRLCSHIVKKKSFKQL